MLKIKNYTKIYSGGKKAVDNVSLDVRTGEIFGFIGHNGAGKTTTIKSIVGVLDFEEGEILIDGKNIKTEPIECKKIMAYIPDNPEIYDQLKGIDYLNFIADIYEVPKNIREEKINKYAKQFEIYNELGNIISSYSHGMKQKLVIISALIHEPKLLVLDEPFVGLDPKSVFILKEIMQEMCQNGSSIFFSSHVLEVVEKLCHRIAIIKNGKLIKYGLTDEIKGDSSLESVFMEMTNNE